jgi:hypothetical protein
MIFCLIFQAANCTKSLSRRRTGSQQGYLQPMVWLGTQRVENCHFTLLSTFIYHKHIWGGSNPERGAFVLGFCWWQNHLFPEWGQEERVIHFWTWRGGEWVSAPLKWAWANHWGQRNETPPPETEMFNLGWGCTIYPICARGNTSCWNFTYVHIAPQFILTIPNRGFELDLPHKFQITSDFYHIRTGIYGFTTLITLWLWLT